MSARQCQPRRLRNWLRLARAGIISGFDMTAEAALAKLSYLFSQNLAVDEIKRLMQTNLRGELTA